MYMTNNDMIQYLGHGRAQPYFRPA